MGGGYLTCASCHGPDGRGGIHTMMGMQTMNATDIRWLVLAGGIEGEHSGGTEEGGHRETGDGYDLKPFRLAVVEGTHPGGKSLSSNMPRWNVSDEDLTDLVVLLFLLFGGGMATSAMMRKSMKPRGSGAS